MDRVLVIDDEDAIADALQELLSWAGFEVALAADGEKGLVELAAWHPQVVLLDYMMPVMDGLTMLRRLRAHPDWHGLPVVLMSAAPLSGVQGTELADVLLRKPFDSGEVLNTLRQLLDRVDGGA